MEGPAWSTGVRFGQSLPRLCDSKVQTQTQPVLSGSEMTRFCYLTRSIIHYVYDLDFETPWFLYLNREQLHFFRFVLFISSKVANNSVCVWSKIVRNR